MSSSNTHPMIYGTAWKGLDTTRVVIEAFQAGFRAFDTAAQPQHYREDLVGDAIRSVLSQSHVDRQDLYIQTKFTPVEGQDLHGPLPYNPHDTITEQVRASIISSLHNLRPTEGSSLVDTYIDCLFLHSPYDSLEDTLEAWAVLEECVPSMIRTLSISNVTLKTLALLHERVKVKPTMVQNRFTPSTSFDVDVRRFCAEKDIAYQAFWTLTANKQLLDSNLVHELASAAEVDKEVALYALIGSLTNVTVLNGTRSSHRMSRDLEGIEKVKVWARDGDSKTWNYIKAQFVEIVGDVT